MKKLLVRCDDFGSATGANEAIVRIAATKLVINVSVLVCGPESRTGLEKLVGSGGRVCLGVHAALNSEWTGVKWGPVDSATLETGLVDSQGHFHSSHEEMLRLPPAVIAREVEAQIQRALSWGVPFRYLDEHMGFGWVPGVAPLLAGLAAAYGLVYRHEVRGLPDLKLENASSVERLRKQIEAIADDNDPCLAIFHPALDDCSTQKLYNNDIEPGVASRERQQDYELLTSDAWAQWVHSNDLHLISYDNL